jgi:hypothetical protein
MFTKRRFSPERVADAIVDAVRRGRSVVPVAPEAWALYLVKRFAPSVGGTVGRVMAWRERAMTK